MAVGGRMPETPPTAPVLPAAALIRSFAWPLVLRLRRVDEHAQLQSRKKDRQSAGRARLEQPHGHGVEPADAAAADRQQTASQESKDCARVWRLFR